MPLSLALLASCLIHGIKRFQQAFSRFYTFTFLCEYFQKIMSQRLTKTKLVIQE